MGRKNSFCVVKSRAGCSVSHTYRKHQLAHRAGRYREQRGTQQETFDTLKSSLKTLEAKLSTMHYDFARLEAI